jgi:hypothetical protein
VWEANEAVFTTSDCPAILIWIDPKRRDPLGLSSRESMLLFPISRTKCIAGAFVFEDNVHRRFDFSRGSRDQRSRDLASGSADLRRPRHVAYLLDERCGIRAGRDLLTATL